jgi:hypothetical protein
MWLGAFDGNIAAMQIKALLISCQFGAPFRCHIGHKGGLCG